MIRHGAGLLHAFSAARVPKVTVVLRKAYGGGFITMNSRELGADLVLAWPGAEIGVLGARQAVGIIHRRAIEASDDPDAEHDRLAAEYAEQHLSADVAAAAGDVDEVIEPAETSAAPDLGALGARRSQRTKEDLNMTTETIEAQSRERRPSGARRRPTSTTWRSGTRWSPRAGR